MEITSFIADTAEEAAAKVRAELGTDAVVVQVRQKESEGIARLWRAPKIEVLAYKPETAPAPAGDAVAALRREVAELREHVGGDETAEMGGPAQGLDHERVALTRGAKGPWTPWRVAPILEQAGFLRLQVQRIVEALEREYGATPPKSLAEELALARRWLERFWQAAPCLPHADVRPHVLVGPPGVGKTTSLCKWLAQAVLVEGQSARAWRLDGDSANGAELLNIYGEILGIPIERTWNVHGELKPRDLNLIDLPGTDWRNPGALGELRAQLSRFRRPYIHLVLNVAYEAHLLMEQARAFSTFSIADLILTHLDEDPRSSKIWNLVLGTKCTVRFVSDGQNIPGNFSTPRVQQILFREFS